MILPQDAQHGPTLFRLTTRPSEASGESSKFDDYLLASLETTLRTGPPVPHCARHASLRVGGYWT